MNQNAGIRKVRFRSQGDGKVCEQCDTLDGQEFDIDDPDLPIPGPEDEGGDTHHNCRCFYEDADLGGVVDIG